MSYRYMRVIVFFDLPSVTVAERKEYLRFRKFLLSDGYIMMQESVYCKLALNMTAVYAMKDRINANKQKDGIVQVMTITEKQYAAIDYVCGSSQKTIIDSDRRLIIL